MPLLAEEGLTRRTADRSRHAGGEAKDALDHYTHEFLCATRRDDTGVIRIDLEELRAVPREIAGRALTLCAASRSCRRLRAGICVALMRLLDALRAPEEMTPRTLHGCLVSKSETQVTIMREFANITDAPVLHPGGKASFGMGAGSVTLDENARGRFSLIRPLGLPPHEVLDALAPGLRKAVYRRAAPAPACPVCGREIGWFLIPSLMGCWLCAGAACKRMAAGLVMRV